MATFTIDEITLVRTISNIDDNDVFELQIKDGGSDNLRSAKITVSELKKLMNDGATPLRYKCLLSQNAPVATTTDPTMVAGQIWTLESYNVADAATIAALELISGTLYAVGSKYRSATNQTLNVNVATTLSYDGSPYIVSTDSNGDFNPTVNTTGTTATFAYGNANKQYLYLTGLVLIDKTFLKISQNDVNGTNLNNIYNDGDNDTIVIKTTDANALYYTSVEIEIYP